VDRKQGQYLFSASVSEQGLMGGLAVRQLCMFVCCASNLLAPTVAHTYSQSKLKSLKVRTVKLC
jgi:hypothetical protein